MRDDNQAMTKVWLRKARLSSKPTTVGIRHSNDPFARIKQPVTKSKKTTLVGKTVCSPHSKAESFSSSAPVSSWKHDRDEVPNYMEYTKVDQNILGPNTKQLQVWPYFGEDVVDDGKVYKEIRERFWVAVDDRPRKVHASQQALAFGPYFEAFVDNIGCSMDHVLTYFLESPHGQHELSARLSKFVVSRGQDYRGADVRAIMTAKEKICRDDYNPSSERWVAVLSKLPKADDEALWKAALACHMFWKATNVSPWQIARKYADVPGPGDTRAKDTKQKLTYEDFKSVACGICHLHDCPYHGMMDEHPESEGSHEEDEINAVDKLDVDHPPKVNYKIHFLTPSKEDAKAAQIIKSTEQPVRPVPRKPVNWWMNEANSVTWDHSKRGTFFPCHHPGESCDTALCSCWEAKICCEKACNCSPDCGRRFRGCSCSSGKRRKLCAQDDSCECYKMNRECDPDLCGPCRVHTVLNPVNRYNEATRKGGCGNAAIQLGLPKRTLLGRSVVHGFGLYAGERIKKDEFIGEYQGEIITGEETERRGVIYEYQKLSYLFDLNKGMHLRAALTTLAN